MPGHADNSLSTLVLTAAAPLDTLAAIHVGGIESLDGLFQVSVDARTEDVLLDLDAAIGQHMTVTLQAGAVARPLDGLCARIEQRPAGPGFAAYLLELRPWLWWLTLASDNRIFQAKSVPDIVEAVFKDYPHAQYELALNGSYAVRDYCVQFNETDFDFVARLLEEEGICYFFRHQAGSHVLVLADAADAFPACPGQNTLAFMPAQAGAREQGAILDGHLGRAAVSGAYRVTDYAFATPATSLFAQAAAGAETRGIYEYPGGYATKSAADALAKKRVDALGAGARQLRGSSDCRALVPGHTFTLTGHERSDANTDWLVVEVRHDASHEQYLNGFRAIPLAASYRPPRVTPRPRIHGAQTAVVVGKSGEEIWTDEFGRIKVQFHWDRLGKNDENSSCWVRVAQMWAGKGWGALFIPRIGQEVVVSFLDGDPDRPLVTGCVYNGSNALPYGLPGEQTKSAIKSESSKGGDGFNEIRFEDKKDAEELYLHAQKDMTTDVLHDALRTVGNDDTLKVKQNQAVTLEEGNRTVAIDKGNDSLSVKGTRSVSVEGAETHTNKADFTQTVDGSFTLTIKGDLTIDVQGKVSIKAGTELGCEAGTALTNKAGTSLTNQSGTDLTNKAGTSLTNDAAISLTSKAGASQTVDGGGMLTLKGGLVKIN